MPRCSTNNKICNMAKIYSKKLVTNNSMTPRKETISFLLNYSKAVSFIKAGKMNIETLAN